LLASVIALIGGVGLYFWSNIHIRSVSQNLNISEEKIRLSPGASIAVLPFKNLSGDPNQEYFSDGITNDIITDLSRFRNLLVIAGATAFTYKKKKVDVRTIGRELSVRYVLEGSVQKTDDAVRINAQLIDATSGIHLWTERYERKYREIFKLQGEIVQAIVTKLAIQTFKHEQDRAMRKKPQDMKAYDYLLKGWAYYQLNTRGANLQAGAMFAKAVDLDQRYADAYVGLGWVEYAKTSYGWTEFPGKALKKAFTNGRKALKLDSDNASGHALLCSVYTFQNQYELAIREAEQAIELNPNDANTYNRLGWAQLWNGQVDEATRSLKMSLRLDSASPRNVWLHLGMAYYLKKQYQEALTTLERGVVKRPDFVGYYIALAATLAQLDRTEQAAQAAETVSKLDPFFAIESFGSAFRKASHREAFIEGLRKAGIK
jgi:adenylate cyclase